MKTVFFLTGDFWHHTETIQPLVSKLFPEDEWDTLFTEDPTELLLMEKTPDLIVSFKDPIENDQIPTPVWCDPEWTYTLFRYVKENGTGVLLVHAALTDLDKNHPIITEMIQSMFTGHPAQCPVSFTPWSSHPILKGVSAFTFPENDEHYMMNLAADAEGEVIGITKSQHGTQPGLWAHTYGKGRVCCMTPGHTTENLTCPGYVQLLSNAVAWCAGTDSYDNRKQLVF